MQDLIADNEI